jgi:hypothetical protein
VTDDERLMALLRDALPAVPTAAPARDLWPVVVRRRLPVSWSWIDLGIAAGVCSAFLWEPGWFVWLLYHL